MAGRDLSAFAPVESPLPPPQPGEVLTESQWTTLMAIGDTIIPSIEESSAPSVTKLSIQQTEYISAINKLKEGLPASSEVDISRKYLEENSSSIPGFREALQRLLGDYTREDARKGIRVILSALE